MATADFTEIEVRSEALEVVEEAPATIEIYEGGIVVAVGGAGGSLDASQVSVSPALGGLTNLETIITRLFNGFTFIQSTPAISWTANHNLGWEPTYSLFNLAGQPITANVEVTTTQAFVTGTIPFTGKLILR